MATRIPRRTHPGYASVGSTQVLIAVGWMTAADMNITVPQVLGATGTATSDPLLVSGWDNFMLFANFSGGGGTTTWEYQILDPQTQAVLLTRTISAAVAPAIIAFTFGASGVTAGSAPGRGDVFHTIALKITANAANQTYNQILLWCGVR